MKEIELVVTKILNFYKSYESTLLFAIIELINKLNKISVLDLIVQDFNIKYMIKIDNEKSFVFCIKFFASDKQFKKVLCEYVKNYDIFVSVNCSINYSSSKIANILYKETVNKLIKFFKQKNKKVYLALLRSKF